jgi:hypothetical protein
MWLRIDICVLNARGDFCGRLMPNLTLCGTIGQKLKVSGTRCRNVSGVIIGSLCIISPMRIQACFRAAIFCCILAHWYKEFQIVIDPRLGGRQCQDDQIYIKLKDLSTWRICPFELMCMT